MANRVVVRHLEDGRVYVCSRRTYAGQRCGVAGCFCSSIGAAISYDNARFYPLCIGHNVFMDSLVRQPWGLDDSALPAEALDDIARESHAARRAAQWRAAKAAPRKMAASQP